MTGPRNSLASSPRPAGLDPADAIHDELLVLVVRTAKAIVDRSRAEFPGAEPTLTVVHGLAARYLLGRDDVTAGELARHLGITKQSTSEVVAALERAGRVRRAPHPSDGRARVLLLTDDGVARLEEGRRRWQHMEDDWAELVGRDRLDVVRDALEAYLAADVASRDRPGAMACAHPDDPGPERSNANA